MVTQPIQSKKSAPAPSSLPPEIAATRMMTEATLWQAIPAQLLAATSLRHGVTEAFFAPATASAKQQPLFDQPHAVGERYRELERMRALELATERTDASRLFLAVGGRGNRIAASAVLEPQAISGTAAGRLGAGHHDLAADRRRHPANHRSLSRGAATTGCWWRSTNFRATADR